MLLWRKNMIRPFRGIHPQIQSSSYIDVSAQLIGDVHIGEESSVWCNAVLRGDMYYIRIGNRTNVQDNSVIHTRTGTHPTILEDEVTIGHSVTLHGCYVERGSLIGIGSIAIIGGRRFIDFTWHDHSATFFSYGHTGTGKAPAFR